MVSQCAINQCDMKREQEMVNKERPPWEMLDTKECGTERQSWEQGRYHLKGFAQRASFRWNARHKEVLYKASHGKGRYHLMSVIQVKCSTKGNGLKLDPWEMGVYHLQRLQRASSVGTETLPFKGLYKERHPGECSTKEVVYSSTSVGRGTQPFKWFARP